MEWRVRYVVPVISIRLAVSMVNNFHLDGLIDSKLETVLLVLVLLLLV